MPTQLSRLPAQQALHSLAENLRLTRRGSEDEAQPETLRQLYLTAQAQPLFLTLGSEPRLIGREHAAYPFLSVHRSLATTACC